MKRGRALIDPAAVMAVEVVAVAAMAAAVATEVAAVAGVATRTVIAVPRATTANRAGNDLRGISPTPGVPGRASRLGWDGEGGLRDQKGKSQTALTRSSRLLPFVFLPTADCLLF